MIWLVLGVVLWCAVHLLPSIGATFKTALVERLGAKGYRGVFSLFVALSLAMIVIGWRTAGPNPVYIPPEGAEHLTRVLMLLAFILAGAAQYPSRIRRLIRHPQLTSVIVWAVAHLISNGDSRSLVLFGGLGLWALLEIPLINARQGAWVKPDAPPLWKEVRGIIISLVVLAVILILHPYFAGVSPLPA